MAFVIGEKQRKAAVMVAEGRKIREIAEVLEVHRVTLWRWWQHPEMQEYAARTYKKMLAQLRRKPWKNQAFKEIHSPDPWAANRAANRILDRFHCLFFDG